MSVLLNAVQRKDSAKRIRRMGYIPGNVYGPGVENGLSVQFEGKVINKFLRDHAIGSKARVKLDDNEVQCVVKNIQYDPINRNPIHIEFYASSEDRPVKVKVPLRFKGRERLAGRSLVLSVQEDEIEIQGMLKDLPKFIEIDVSSMDDGSIITMGDVILPEGIKLLSKKDEIVATVAEAETVETSESDGSTASE